MPSETFTPTLMEIPSTVGSAYLRFWVQSAPHLLSKQNPQHPFPNEPIRDLLLPLHQHSRHWYLLNDAHDVPLHGHYQVRKQRRPCSKRLRPMFWRILPSTFHLHLPPYHDDHQGRHRSPLHYHPHRQRPHQNQPPPPPHLRMLPLRSLLPHQSLPLCQYVRGGSH